MKKKIKKSLLIFAHHGKGNFSRDALIYLREISKYFSRTIVGTDLTNPPSLPVEFMFCENKGYDFGIYYQVLKRINHFEFDRIALVNDSNSLVNTFEDIFKWGDSNNLDFWGLTDSKEKTHGTKIFKDTYHIQSHFLVLERKTLPHLINFFMNLDFENEYMIDSGDSRLRDRIIDACEIGFSVYLQRYDIKMGAKWSVLDRPRLNKDRLKIYNMHFWDWEWLIVEGYPLIKNKILNGEWSQPNPKQPYIVPNANRSKKYYRNFLSTLSHNKEI